eukprot:gnl/MRDRNA2_/MRDRNA2_129339_c0_seq1.p1 gnl/MRDRNA2_/MRDRNA2_129339_c0~~gnl/MRDRNA2_/MRDRNA2_129339_c0_seq1.p1  ORF type:complete len:445 (+),score=71.50 gnl/MRDRNA2_/MRDRNA2_129339_c0_seq1:134-1468(+)
MATDAAPSKASPTFETYGANKKYWWVPLLVMSAAVAFSGILGCITVLTRRENSKRVLAPPPPVAIQPAVDDKPGTPALKLSSTWTRATSLAGLGSCMNVTCDFIGPMFDDIPGMGDIGNFQATSLDDCLKACMQVDVCAAAQFSPHIAQSGQPYLENILSCHLYKHITPRSGARFIDFELHVRYKDGMTVGELVPETWKATIAGSPKGLSKDQWIDQELRKIHSTGNLMDPLGFVLMIPALVPDDAFVLEFGVFVGKTINQISAQRPRSRIYGFDSFIGLPEDWHIGVTDGKASDRVLHKDTFNLHGVLPKVGPNVELIKGWFNYTLPDFLSRPGLVSSRGRVDLVHVDCDLYSASVDVFTILGSSGWLKPGTVFVFDELVNFPEFRNHEFKAFYEFLVAHPEFGVEWLSTPCGVDTVMGHKVGYLEGDGTCLAAAAVLTSATI